MKRSAIIIAAIIIVGGGVALGLWFMKPAEQPANQTTTNENGPSVSTDQPATGDVTVRMQNTKFSPATVSVKKGAKVTWVNDDSVQHNVVASDSVAGGLPTQNALLSKGGSYSFTFNNAGTFTYHCVPHPFMTGTIVVE